MANMINRTLTTLTTIAALALPFAANAETVMLHGTLSGATEVPAKTTQGKGTVTASIDTSTKMVTYKFDYSDLTGPATAAHFHGPAEPGANAGVLVPIPAPLTSPINGTATLTDAQMNDMLAGKTYANIHTAANPGGEVRAQMTK